MAHVALARVPVMFCGFAAFVVFTTEAQPHIRVRSLQQTTRPIPVDSVLRRRLLTALRVPMEVASKHEFFIDNSDGALDVSFSGGAHASVVVFPNHFFPPEVEHEQPDAPDTSHVPQPFSALQRDRQLADEGVFNYSPDERAFVLSRVRTAIGQSFGIGTAQWMVSAFGLSSTAVIPYMLKNMWRLTPRTVAVLSVLPVICFCGAFGYRAHDFYSTTLSQINQNEKSGVVEDDFSRPTFQSVSYETRPSLLYAAHSLARAERILNLRRGALRQGSFWDGAFTTADGDHLGEIPLASWKRKQCEKAMVERGLEVPQHDSDM